MFASLDGTIQAVMSLLEAGANTQLKEINLRTSVMMACYKGRPEILQLLINYGADVNAKDDFGRTALALASDCSVDCCRILIRHGADVNTADDKFGGTPLILACCQGDINIIRVLVEEGKADVNQVDLSGRSPLMIASYKGQAEAIHLLVSNGAHIYVKDKKFGMNSLMLSSHMGHKACVEILLASGADTDSKDFDGVTAAKTSKTLDILQTIVNNPFEAMNYFLK